MTWIPGTILKRPISGLLGLFLYPTGVYVGNGLVVHFNGETNSTGIGIGGGIASGLLSFFCIF